MVKAAAHAPLRYPEASADRNGGWGQLVSMPCMSHGGSARRVCGIIKSGWK